ncbi:MAG: VWA domain-containing protein [Acidobacteriota bacterium]|nr:VWA domain-containing protein [Acidobacteriota bacterium]
MKPRFFKGVLVTVAGWTLTIGVCGSLAAQVPVDQAQAEAASEEFFSETVNVNVVNVEVYVTDKKGHPITGLTQDDFRVFEDKRPVAVTNFYVMEEGRSVGAEAAESPPEAPQVAVERSAPDASPSIPEQQRLSLVLYIDNFNIRPFNRNRVLKRVRQFLAEHLDRDDRVMLVSYERTLTVRHPFTSDPRLISSALFDLEDNVGHAMTKDSDREEVLEAIVEADSLGEVEWRVRQYAETEYNDLSFTIDAMRELVGSLGGLPGRKAILYVSDGLAMKPGEDLYHALLRKFSDSSVLSRSNDYMAARRFNELVARANSNRVSFYTIDAAGLRISSSVSVTSRSGGGNFDTLVDSINFSNLQSTIRMMAEETGGFAIVNTNDPTSGLNRMAGDFNNYYSLGYPSTASEDGRYHRIKVEVDRPGVKVRHREGYRGKSSFTRMADGTTSTLLYGFERNPMAVSLAVGTGNPGEGGHYVVPMEIRVPLDKVVLIPRSDFHHGRVKVYFSAMDETGGMSDVQEMPVDIRIPSDELEDALGRSWAHRVEVQMRVGNQRIGVGVRDEMGATESFLARAVTIGSG